MFLISLFLHEFLMIYEGHVTKTWHHTFVSSWSEDLFFSIREDYIIYY